MDTASRIQARRMPETLKELQEKSKALKSISAAAGKSVEKNS